MDWIDRVLINNNGTIQAACDAQVPALDHGFLYGDSVYETLRTYQARPFLLGAHMDRLERSIGRIGLTCPCSRKDLEKEVLRVIGAYREGDFTSGALGEVDPGNLAVRVVISRGIGPIGLDVTLCEDPRFLIYAFPIPERPLSYYQEGISLVISKVRRNHPQALDPGIKSGNFLNNILAFNDAREAGVQEAVLLNAEGYVAEGTTSNVFMVSDGRLRTPIPQGILSGITRAVVLEEALAAGIETEECRFTSEELLSAEEAFITSSVRGVVPVAAINGMTIGKPGSITRTVMELYEARVRKECG